MAQTSFAGFLGACALSIAIGAAQAQTADDKPDKSRYTLFNPTPPDQMRSFATDRPTKSNVPYTVDAGHFQYEADIFNYLHNNSSSNVRTYGAPVLKLGLTNSTDFELGMTGLFQQARGTPRGEGFGDLVTRLKWNLWGNDGGDTALAVIPYVKWPTATDPALGNNRVEGGLIAPLALKMPLDFTMILMTEVDALKNQNDSGTHANFINLVNLNRPLFDPNVTGYVEFFSDVSGENHVKTAYTLDFAVSWVVMPDLPNLQLDSGVNIGLNNAAPDYQAYVGIAQRF